MSESLPTDCDVAIVGAGPSGLSTAVALKRLGVGNVLVLEREPAAGGIPRHCGHPPFGMREFKRIMRGPSYARALVESAQKHGVSIHTSTSVAALRENGELLVTSPDGIREFKASAVVLATGVRETPRSARFVSGQRPLGVMSTGALQSMVYLSAKLPFRRPVVVGTELVSFSTLLTCRHAGITPVAMLESGSRVVARVFASALPRLLGVDLQFNTRIDSIVGKSRVSGVDVINENGRDHIACDGVLFTGQFVPESTLMRIGHLEVDPLTGGPVVDQFGRCSDPAYFATGNLLRPVETAGWCWAEGRACAENVVRVLAGELPSPTVQASIVVGDPAIKYVMPQRLSVPVAAGAQSLQLRMARRVNGRLMLRVNGEIVWSKTGVFLPERRILIPLSTLPQSVGLQSVEVDFESR